jgi:hypothetical protein
MLGNPGKMCSKAADWVSELYGQGLYKKIIFKLIYFFTYGKINTSDFHLGSAGIIYLYNERASNVLFTKQLWGTR